MLTSLFWRAGIWSIAPACPRDLEQVICHQRAAAAYDRRRNTGGNVQAAHRRLCWPNDAAEAVGADPSSSSPIWRLAAGASGTYAGLVDIAEAFISPFADVVGAQRSNAVWPAVVANTVVFDFGSLYRRHGRQSPTAAFRYAEETLRA
ncbi:hypothetical protein PE067_14035 [Paracoccus sp. DMF-8]|uniref:hypothetical protein n=1 Tax=Paracoccus sp. DMF-8 TaxID=3019445 RepID=UPI0023E8AAE1|nr:hypothetical protein [Paracoccus sp. DMF-8]MDF3607155.1 hypothetical protein [Paracoccus sp. DMF-8]